LATSKPTRSSSESLTNRAVELVLERKAENVLSLDLDGISSATDFFVIASGGSDVHVRAIAEHVVEELKRDGERPGHVEGLQGGQWVLIDYIDVVVHVFLRAARDFYQLETLWGDAKTTEHESEPGPNASGVDPA